jgi:hypothetical protein
MLCMSLHPVVLLLLWVYNCTRIPEVALPTAISLIFVKQCSKVISQTGKFIFFVIHSRSEKKVTPTSMTSTKPSLSRKNQVDGIMEDYRDIFSSCTRIPMHFRVKHPIDITPDAPLPNGLVYHYSLMENDEIKHQIQEVLQNGNI